MHINVFLIFVCYIMIIILLFDEKLDLNKIIKIIKII